MMKISSSLHEYLHSLKNIHLFNNHFNDDWGFFIDIEPKTNTNTTTNKLSNGKYRNHFKPSFKNRIHSHKSISNLDQLTDTYDPNTYDPIFKMDEDYEEENQRLKEYNDHSKQYKKMNLIGNICVVSSIVLFLFLL